jgi:hypothetical protein
MCARECGATSHRLNKQSIREQKGRQRERPFFFAALRSSRSRHRSPHTIGQLWSQRGGGPKVRAVVSEQIAILERAQTLLEYT